MVYYKRRLGRSRSAVFHVKCKKKGAFLQPAMHKGAQDKKRWEKEGGEKEKRGYANAIALSTKEGRIMTGSGKLRRLQLGGQMGLPNSWEN